MNEMDVILQQDELENTVTRMIHCGVFCRIILVYRYWTQQRSGLEISRTLITKPLSQLIECQSFRIISLLPHRIQLQYYEWVVNQDHLPILIFIITDISTAQSPVTMFPLAHRSLLTTLLYTFLVGRELPPLSLDIAVMSIRTQAVVPLINWLCIHGDAIACSVGKEAMRCGRFMVPKKSLCCG